MTTQLPQCIFCRHYRKGAEGPTCSAFPDGIPAVMLRNDHDHREPYRGDNGIRFEPIDAESGRIVAELFDDSEAQS